jgi:protoporphyrinogen/coproporphyrinogen III oxidase
VNHLHRTDASRSSVVVVGGGISGLAAAYQIRQAAPGARVTLLEATDRLGGKILTERCNNFVIEAGPDSFLANKPRGVGLCQELGIAGDLQGVTPRQHRAFVLFRGRLHELPEGLTGLVPTRLGPLIRSTLLSPRGKARVALDYILPPRRANGDESLGAFICRRLGREAWERLVEPLMAGIYAADGDTLSLAATFPQLRDAERRHGGLIRGVLAGRRAGSATSGPTGFLAPAGGMGQLVVALSDRLYCGDVVMMTGVAAEAITKQTDGYVVQLANNASIPADAVIVATPAFIAADLLSTLDAPLAADLEAIPHVSTAIVTFAFRGDEIAHSLDGHGYVVPRSEGSPVLACTWTSRKWAQRAPEGWELIRAFLGRSGHLQDEIDSADDEILIGLARAEVNARLGVSAQPSHTTVQRWSRGMPQYQFGHLERVARIMSALDAHPGLFIAGNAFGGVGIPDCIASGERAADAAAAYLSSATQAGERKAGLDQ